MTGADTRSEAEGSRAGATNTRHAEFTAGEAHGSHAAAALSCDAKTGWTRGDGAGAAAGGSANSVGLGLRCRTEQEAGADCRGDGGDGAYSGEYSSGHVGASFHFGMH